MNPIAIESTLVICALISSTGVIVNVLKFVDIDKQLNISKIKLIIKHFHESTTMATFDDLDSSFEEGNTKEFIKIFSNLKSANDSQDDEPLLVYLTRLLGSDESTGKEDIFRHLVSKGGKLDVQDDVGRTPLSNLAFNNNLHYFKLLIELGADINFAGDDEAPIERAIRSNDSIEVAKFILANPKYVPLPTGALSDVAKRSGAKQSIALLKELKIK